MIATSRSVGSSRRQSSLSSPFVGQMHGHTSHTSGLPMDDSTSGMLDTPCPPQLELAQCHALPPSGLSGPSCTATALLLCSRKAATRQPLWVKAKGRLWPTSAIIKPTEQSAPADCMSQALVPLRRATIGWLPLPCTAANHYSQLRGCAAPEASAVPLLSYLTPTAHSSFLTTALPALAPPAAALVPAALPRQVAQVPRSLRPALLLSTRRPR